MRPAASLERGYRRLLRCYPAGHRDVHGEEMLGVLLAGARPGQRQPGLPESASLICGAVRIRLRGTWPDSSDRWRDTLAQTSLVLPLLIAAVALTQLALHAPGGQQPAIARWLMPHLYLVSWNGPEWWPLVPLAALAVPAALGWRQGTGFVALPLAALCAIQVGSDMLNAHRGIEPSLISPGTALWLAVLAIEALALAASPGPRRGRALLSRRHYLLIIAAGVAIGAVGTVGLWYHRVTPGGYSTAFRPPWPALVLGGLVTVISAAMLIRRAASRRLLVTLALPAYFFVFDGVYGSSFVPDPPPAYLLPLALLPLAVILMSLRWYRRHHRAPADGQGT
jgi:hypothetical protein